MRISKKLLFIVVPVLLLLGAGTIAYAAGAVSFTDIAGHWAEASIVKEAERGVVQGHADGTFGPDEFVTRAQVVTFLDRFNTGITCTECHNSGTELTGKATAWAASKHGTGTAYLRAASKDCAGCHSGGSFSAMIAAGQNPTQVTAGDPNPTRQDCRACHQIHETGTSADWALETTAPVKLYVSGTTFNGGAGNLCVNCHQPRTAFPAAVDGMVSVDSTHWGPHHGPQSAMLLGLGGADLTGNPMFHYTAVNDTCVTCHMGKNTSHTFQPNIATCSSTCHPGATSFDIDGTQTKVQAKLDQLQASLTAKGLLSASGSPVVGKYPEAQAAALWNWIYVSKEDKSKGVHNPAYTNALLDAAIAAIGS